MKDKVFVADLQCLLAAFLFGVGFLGQRAISVDGLGPMTCNAFRFGISAILLILCFRFIPKESISGDIILISDDEDEDLVDDNSSSEVNNQSLKSPSRQSHHSSHGDVHYHHKVHIADVEEGVTTTKSSVAPIKKNRFRYQALKKNVWFWGLSLGLLNFLGSGFQQWGITMTTASKVAFISGFDLFLTPIFGLFIPTFKLNGNPLLSTWVAVCVSLTGLFLLSETDLNDFTLGTGETLTVISTVFWTLHITYTDIATSYVDTLMMMVIQLGSVAFLSAVTAFYIEPQQWFWAHMLPYWHWLLFLAIADGAGFVLMAAGQNFAPPTHAAIILSLEGVFAAGASYVFLGERLSTRETTGCILMLAATLMAEIGVPLLDNISFNIPLFRLRVRGKAG